MIPQLYTYGRLSAHLVPSSQINEVGSEFFVLG